MAERRTLFLRDLLDYPSHPGSSPDVQILVQVRDPATGKVTTALATVSDILDLIVGVSLKEGERYRLANPLAAADGYISLSGVGSTGDVGVGSGDGQVIALIGISGYGAIGAQGSLGISGGGASSASLTGFGGASGNGSLVIVGVNVGAVSLVGQGSASGYSSINVSGGGTASVSVLGYGSSGDRGVISVVGQVVSSVALSGYGGTAGQGALVVAGVKVGAVTLSGVGSAGGYALGSVAGARVGAVSLTGRGAATSGVGTLTASSGVAGSTITEGFEAGPTAWPGNGDAGLSWSRDSVGVSRIATGSAHSGSNCLQIDTQGSLASASITLTHTSSGNLRFWAKATDGFPNITVYIDASSAYSAGPGYTWVQSTSIPYTSGTHTYKFEVIGDGELGILYIDDITWG